MAGTIKMDIKEQNMRKWNGSICLKGPVVDTSEFGMRLRVPQLAEFLAQLKNWQNLKISTLER